MHTLPYKHPGIGLSPVLVEPIDKPLYASAHSQLSDADSSACNSSSVSFAVPSSGATTVSTGSSSLPAHEKPTLTARYTCKVPIVGHADTTSASFTWAKPDKKATPLDLAASTDWPNGCVEHELELCLLEGVNDPARLSADDLAKVGWQLHHQGQDTSCSVSSWQVLHRMFPGSCLWVTV